MMLNPYKGKKSFRFVRAYRNAMIGLDVPENADVKLEYRTYKFVYEDIGPIGALDNLILTKDAEAEEESAEG